MHTDIRYWMRNVSGSLHFSFILPRHARWHQMLNKKCQWQPWFQLCFTKTCTLTSDTEWETTVAALIWALFYQDMHTDIRYWMRNVSGSLHFSFVKPRPVTKNWVSWLLSVCLWEIMPRPLFQLVQMFCAGPESGPVQTLQTSFGWDYKPRSPVCIRMQKHHIHTSKIL